jgi:hypothetical protein
MSRTVEVALIPVFQFGVFSESDLSFFAGVNLTFAGRTHTNGDLYLDAGTGATTTFQDKVTAWGNVIRTVLANGNTSAATAHLGTVDILTAALGCNPPQPACRAMAQAEGSVVAGPTSPQNPNWLTNISIGLYNSWIIDGNYGKPGGTGASQLSLPFVNNALGLAGQPQPFEIIRRPPAGESPTSALGASRLYNEAEIRVLLSDTPADLPGGVADPNNIRLANPNVAGATYQFGVPASVPAGLPALASGGTYNTYFAAGTTSYPDTSTWTNAFLPLGSSWTLAPDWPYAPLQPIAADITFTNDQGPPAAPLTTPTADTNVFGMTSAPAVLNLTSCPGNPPVCPGAPIPYYNAPYPYYTATAVAATNTWNLIDGYLRVEYRDAAGVYHPITAEWLQLGFARGTLPPNSAAVPAIPNSVNPNAILILQEPADRNGNGVIDQTGAGPSCSKSAGVWTCVKAKPPEVTVDLKTLYPWYGDSKAAVQSVSMNNWYPINLYDAREGEVRDVNQGNASCAPAGVMNAVEIDVGNLAKWINGTIPGSGGLVDPVFQNGYVLYFSDRRGMLPNPNGTQVDAAGTKTGDSGLEDSVNSGAQVGNPDGLLEATPPGKLQSPEDVNNNGVLDNWGA